MIAATELNNWPRKEFYWEDDGKTCISIPFTWNIPDVLERQRAIMGYYYKHRDVGETFLNLPKEKL